MCLVMRGRMGRGCGVDGCVIGSGVEGGMGGGSVVGGACGLRNGGI